MKSSTVDAQFYNQFKKKKVSIYNKKFRILFQKLSYLFIYLSCVIDKYKI